MDKCQSAYQDRVTERSKNVWKEENSEEDEE